MPTMPPPGGPQPTGPVDETEIKISTGTKVAALALGAAIFLASRGRIGPKTYRFISHNAVKGIVGLGTLALGNTAGHEEDERKKKKSEALRAIIEAHSTMPSPSGKYVTVVGNKTGKRVRIPIEALQEMIDAGLIKVRNKKTGEPISKINMPKFWNTDP